MPQTSPTGIVDGTLKIARKGGAVDGHIDRAFAFQRVDRPSIGSLDAPKYRVALHLKLPYFPRFQGFAIAWPQTLTSIGVSAGPNFLQATVVFGLFLLSQCARAKSRELENRDPSFRLWRFSCSVVRLAFDRGRGDDLLPICF